MKDFSFIEGYQHYLNYHTGEGCWIYNPDDTLPVPPGYIMSFEVLNSENSSLTPCFPAAENYIYTYHNSDQSKSLFVRENIVPLHADAVEEKKKRENDPDNTKNNILAMVPAVAFPVETTTTIMENPVIFVKLSISAKLTVTRLKSMLADITLNTGLDEFNIEGESQTIHDGYFSSFNLDFKDLKEGVTPYIGLKNSCDGTEFKTMATLTWQDDYIKVTAGTSFTRHPDSSIINKGAKYWQLSSEVGYELTMYIYAPHEAPPSFQRSSVKIPESVLAQIPNTAALGIPHFVSEMSIPLSAPWKGNFDLQNFRPIERLFDRGSLFQSNSTSQISSGNLSNHKSFWTKVGSAFKSNVSSVGNAALTDLKSFNARINSFSNDVNIFGNKVYRVFSNPARYVNGGSVYDSAQGDFIPARTMTVEEPEIFCDI